jgi:hypothetical protein
MFESAVIQIIDVVSVCRFLGQIEFLVDTGGADCQYNIFAEQFDTLGLWKRIEGEDDAEGHSHYLHSSDHSSAHGAATTAAPRSSDGLHGR